MFFIFICYIFLALMALTTLEWFQSWSIYNIFLVVFLIMTWSGFIALCNVLCLSNIIVTVIVLITKYIIILFSFYIDWKFVNVVAIVVEWLYYLIIQLTVIDIAPSWFLKILKLPLFYLGNFKTFKNALRQFILNHPSKHAIAITCYYF